MKRFCFLYLALLVVLIKGHDDIGESQERPSIQIKQGVLRGTIQTSSLGKEFEAFEGIPYAEPPVGKNRFKEPKPAKPWKGIWDASKKGSPCLQYSHYSKDFTKYPVLGDEDCLFLNVYRPKGAEAGSDLPVIIFIHGGAFMYMMHLNGPKYLLDRNVIYVNIQYRLGPIGFLSTGDDVVPGNNGLKDQSAALRWIKENIHQFGGDSNKITITGLSAGGASVHYHYLSPLSKGLFAQGISVSGCALVPWGQAEKPLEKAQKLAGSLGCPTDNTKDMVDCLYDRPARKIVEAVKLFQPWLYNPFSPFGPVVEKGGSKPFLSEHPVDIIKTKKVRDIPWIAIVTQAEGLYPAAEFAQSTSTYLKQLEDNWLEYAPDLLDYNYTIPKSQHNSISKKVKQHYLKGEKLAEKTFPELIQMIGDRMFVVPLEQCARLQAAATSSPVYFYKFNYRGEHSISDAFSGKTENYGVSHGDDVMYLLSVEDDYFKSNDDLKIQNQLLDLWIKYTKEGVPQFGDISWEPVIPNAEDIRYLEINGPDDYRITSASELGHTKFWESIPFNENKKHFIRKDEL